MAGLPKAHLHLHFTGSLRFDTLVHLARVHGIRLPYSLLAQEPLGLDPSARGWFRFQRLYDAARHAVVDEAAMRRVVREAAEDDAAEGSGRLELQVDPTTYGAHLGGITPALEIVMDEARAAGRDTGVDIGLVVAASRLRHPLEARTLARLAAKYAGDGPGEVVGFGLSNDERRGDTAAFAPAFALARRAGLAAVPHGGELLGPEHIRQIVSYLKPDRLGHGVRAVEDPTVLAELAESGIALELCPLSNVALGVFARPADVPLPQLLEAGLTVALNADDPLIFRTRLVDQYRWARDVLGFGDAALADLARASIRASRARDQVKRDLLAGVDAWLAAPPGRV